MENLRLIQALQNPNLYNHPVTNFKVIETHLSWVLLTGPYAYKIKKAIKLNFVDFSTLEKRHFYCEEELRLNRRLAPSLYLGVLPIRGSMDDPILNLPSHPAHNHTHHHTDDHTHAHIQTHTQIDTQTHTQTHEPIIEWVVKMQQFDQNQLLSNLVEQQALPTSLLYEIANTMALFHQNAPVSEQSSSFGSLSSIQTPMLDNFLDSQVLLEKLDHNELKTPPEHKLPNNIQDNTQDNSQDNFQKIMDQLNNLQLKSNEEFSKLQTFFNLRKKNGFIRECHGDCHLGNMVLMDKKLLIFDCIDFNAEFRWIDTFNEIAFLTMDLQARASTEDSFIFLNHYLEITGDYSGLSLLRFYQTYRAMVRAKVALLTNNPHKLSEFRKYLELAQMINQASHPKLIITYGLSGSGKTWLSSQLAPKIPAIHLRSDIERKRLMLEKTDRYSLENQQKVYDRVLELSQTILKAGYSVIVDATFLRYRDRENFYHLAKHLQVPFVILHCETDNLLLRKRILERATEKKDASEANLSVLDYQEDILEPLTETERENRIVCQTEHKLDFSVILQDLHLKKPILKANDF